MHKIFLSDINYHVYSLSLAAINSLWPATSLSIATIWYQQASCQNHDFETNLNMQSNTRLKLRQKVYQPVHGRGAG